MTTPDVSSKIRPYQDRLLVMKLTPANVTAGGLHIPETAQGESPLAEGAVVAVGTGIHENGHLRELGIEVGDRVLFAKRAGATIKVEGAERHLLRSGDVVAVIPKAHCT